MRNLIAIILLAIIVSSCASSYISDQNITEPEKAFHHILVLSLFNETDLKQFDEETYNASVKDHFYNLDRIDHHPLLQKCVKKQLSSNRTVIVPCYKLFKVNQEVSYNEFLETIDKKDIDAILLINQKNYYYEKSERILEDGEIRVTESPNAIFNSYLIDRKDLKPVWLGRINSNGTSWDSSFDLYNSMGRQLRKRLINAGYIRQALNTHSVRR